MGIRQRVGRLEKAIGEPEIRSLEELLNEADEEFSRVYQMDDEALLRLVDDKNETRFARHTAIYRLVYLESINYQTKIRLLERLQTEAQAELDAAQELDTTANSRKERKSLENLKDMKIRGATCQLERIQMEILKLQT